MRLRIVAVGQKLPDWAEQAVSEYCRRMPPECRVEVVAVAAAPRARKPDVSRILQIEGERLQRQLLSGSLLVALDERGRALSTRALADTLEGWMGQGRDTSLLIGGADGLAPELKARAEQTIALSALTLPHALARVVLVEALYRAWSLATGHPYHRA